MTAIINKIVKDSHDMYNVLPDEINIKDISLYKI